MEPTSKKRKLAPKVDASPAPNVHQPGPFPPHDSSQHLPPLQRQPQPPPSSLPPPPAAPHHAIPELPPLPAAERHDFESFARHLQDAAMLIQRQTERSTYGHVSVLLLSWDGDNSGNHDLAALDDVLQTKYNYGTQRWRIPTVPNPSIKLGVQMASFLEQAKQDSLLIVYYAGHGFVGSDGHLYWANNTREDAFKIKWDGVRCLFEDAQSDILLLLDSCSIPDPPQAGSHGVKQAIAAYSPEHNTRDDSRRSFTSTLVDVLHKFGAGRPFSVHKLYEEVLSQRRQLLTRPEPGAPNALSPSLPHFFTLTPGNGHSLTLSPLPNLRRPVSSHNSGDATEAVSGLRREDHLIDFDSASDLRFEEARILVCTTFVGDASPDMSFFNQWLQNTPPLGAQIAVEGMFLGPPTMLLISMPSSVWNVVQHDKVCCFLGYITSHNMLQLYEKLVSPSGIRPPVRQVQEGRMLPKLSELTAGPPVRERPDIPAERLYPRMYDRPVFDTRQEHGSHGSPTRAATIGGSTPIVSGTEKPKIEVEDSAEMQEAAEQLKALSHVRHRSDESHNAMERRRTTLPDATPEKRRTEAGMSRDQPQLEPAHAGLSIEFETTPNSRGKPRRRSLPKQETRCNHCSSHPPFKDSSSLRKHIAAAHTRPFPCAFSFAGCTSTFGSKNEWKRHIASQHLCMQYYRCSMCSQTTADGKGNEFNRKDLFTQHLRRMHAPFQIKKAVSKGDSKLQSEWEALVKEMQQSCLVTRRLPPQRSACPKPDCMSVFEGPGAWDDWTEHVGRHLEKGESQGLEIDGILAQWALDEGIIERQSGGGYRLCANNGLLGGNGGSLEHRESIPMDSADLVAQEAVSRREAQQAVQEMEAAAR